MAHLASDDGHAVRRSKSNHEDVFNEGAAWDFASTADNNSLMAPGSADSVAINSPVNNFSKGCASRLNKSKPCGCKCSPSSHKATPTNNDVGEANAPETSGHQPLKTRPPPV